MKFLLIVAALAHAAYSGNVGVRTSNLLAPAGVTYVDGSYHAGLAAGPVAYSAQPVYQSVAAAAPVAVPAAPVAYAAPVTKYAAVPTVQHVPGVADVPVTRIDAQPGVIQKTVDVARPAVKTQRFEVRRPAIQKEFYDIEERVVVRPAGSAVVELDEPLSKQQKGPSVIRPTGDGVAVTSSAVAVPTGPIGPGVSVGAVPSVTVPAPPVIAPPGIAPPGIAPGVADVSSSEAELPSVEINLARSSLPASVGIARSSISPASVEISRTAYAAAPAPVPSVGIARTAYAAPAPVPSVEVRASIPTASPAPLPSVGIARTAYAAAPAPIPSVGIARTAYAAAPAPVPSVGIARTAYAAPAPVPSVEVRASVPSVSPAPLPSVAFARSSFAAPAPVQSISYSAPVAAPSVGISYPVKTVSVSAPVQPPAISISPGSSAVSVSGPSEVSFSTPAPQYQQQIVQTTPVPQVSDDSEVIESADFSLARSSGLSRSYNGQTFAAPARAPAPVHEPLFRSELPPRRFTGQTASSRSSLAVNYPNALDLIPQSRFSSAAVYSEGNLQSEINHENQAKLLQLLTARGGVTEVGFGRSGPASSYPVEAGQVRARVLSATPAPAYAAPTGERVNTRRVVVSRPIETLQEVEVAEPVTKFERVRVDQPAVLKTASQDVVRVPTSVPVYGKTLAPIAEAPVAPVAPVGAYSADWQ